MASNKEIVFITGGNTGLGYEVVKALYQSPRPYEIIVGCRTVSKGEEAIATLQKEVPDSASTLSVQQADLESDASLEQAVEAISSKHGGRLDVLINNGGASFDFDIAPAGRGMSVRDAFNAMWDVNVSGTHVLTQLAAPLLLQSASPRLLFVTSGTSTLAETEVFDTPMAQRLNASPPAGWPKVNPPGTMSVTGYRSAKTGLNMLMREWARILRNDGVKVWAVSPGFLATGLGGGGADRLRAAGALDPAVGGETVRDVVERKRDGEVGKVVRRDMVQPW
ncbi:Short-chain dehydrogenase/reductase 2b [Apiospora phragmitis]|uniref:Short-chain dehydrogenase/reductase 2b n=1 Tax=Apiospora phragmitis TaxID=2905665 RepID=A0ABR1W6K5_9PEZI